MQAMILKTPGSKLLLADVEKPTPKSDELLLEVLACAVCRTDLHVVDGELTNPKLPIIPGHEIVGRVVQVGAAVKNFRVGDRVGVPWLGGTCGHCQYCLSGKENLCDNPTFTGYQKDGGYAQYTVARADYSFPLPDQYSDTEAAPLLCAGLIGYRCLKFAGEGNDIGLYGFGAAAHIIIQVAKYQGRRVFAFTKPNDEESQTFAKSLGAFWAGGSDQEPPVELDAAIIFAPAGELVPQALRAVKKAGIVVCGGIHMSDIPSFPYDILWQEKVLRSVANLTRQDAIDFLALAPKVPVKTKVSTYKLSQANQALDDLRAGRFDGAAVLLPNLS